MELRKFFRPPAKKMNLIITQIIAVITPYLVGTGKHDANLGAKIYFMWGSLCLISSVFAYFFVPETKGLTLEQVDRMMEESSPRKSAKWAPHSTFAADMGLAGKDIEVGQGSNLHEIIEKAQGGQGGVSSV